MSGETPIFTPEFLAIPPSEIAEAIRSDGFFTMQHAVSAAWIERITADVAAHPFAINKNWVTCVYANTQYYLTHMLACSQAFFNYCTHAKIFEICENLLGTQFRLKAMRYYETYGRHHMQWHTDNKTDRGFAHIPGLIFIVYLADVHDGEFQYVRGSQNWSGDKAYSDYADAFIQAEHGHQVVSFKAPKATIVIYDTYGIHRAKPVADKDFVRKSLFFQIDSNMDSAEPILLNPAFISPAQAADSIFASYLGFGAAAEYEVYPHTHMNTLPLSRISISKWLAWCSHRLARSAYNTAPYSLKQWLRRMMGKNTL